MSLTRARAVLSGTAAFALVLAACQTAPPVTPTAAPTAQAGGVASTSIASSGATAHVDLLKGTAQWRPDNQSNWQPVTGSFDLPIGAEIRTDQQGQATVTLADGSRMNLDTSSQIALQAYDADGTTPESTTTRLARIGLSTGNVAFEIKPVAGASAFEFRTDDQVAVIRGTSGSLAYGASAVGQAVAGSLNLTMTQGTALVGCVVQDATANAPKVNILQAGLGQPVSTTSGSCQSIQSMPDPNRAAGLLDAYGVALSGPPDGISAVANGDLPGALDKLSAAWGRPV